jgi:hypothetical protein
VRFLKIFAFLLGVLIVGQAKASVDGVIPYPDKGTINPVVYTFVAQETGTVNAYFAGTTALYYEELGLEINGVNSGQWGLNNHLSAIGDEMSWNVVKGDVLTFVNYVWGWYQPSFDSSGNPTGGYYQLSSNPSANPDGNNHVYSTNFNASQTSQLHSMWNGTPPTTTIPNGVFVAFEDEPTLAGYPASDYNYNDLDFVFTNVGSSFQIAGSVGSAAVPEPATLALFVAGLWGMAVTRRKRLAV